MLYPVVSQIEGFGGGAGQPGTFQKFLENKVSLAFLIASRNAVQCQNSHNLSIGKSPNRTFVYDFYISFGDDFEEGQTFPRHLVNLGDS